METKGPLPGGTGWVLLGSSLALVYAVCVRPIVPWDLRTFLDAGRAVWLGANPYPAPGTPEILSGHAFVYPWVTAWVFTPLSGLPLSIARAAFFVISVGAVAGACFLAGRREPLVTGAAATSSLAVLGFQVGSIEGLLLLGLVGCWRFRDRTALLALLAAGVVVAKLFLAPLLIWLLLSGRWRAALGSTAIVGAFLALGCSLGPVGLPDYLHLLSALSRHEAVHSWSVTAMLTKVGAPLTVASDSAAAVGFLAPFLVCARRRRRQDDRALFVAALVASLVATPIMWSHYLLLVFALPLVLGAAPWCFALFGLGTWLLVTPYDSRLVVQVAAVACWAAAAMAARRTSRRTARLTAPLAPVG